MLSKRLFLASFFLPVWLLAACGGSPSTPVAPETLTPVTLTGYYVALDAVRVGTAQFGTSLLADIIVTSQQSNDLKSIAQIQQTNGLLLLAKKSSGISQPKDFSGKRVGVWLGNWAAQFDALVAKEGLKPTDLTLVSQAFSMDACLKGNLDVASAMIYNEDHSVVESGVKPEAISIINYADFGLNFPGEVLFTSAKFAQENPEICVKMLCATLRGWQYAIEHPEEAVEIVMKHDKSGVFDARSSTFDDA
jgi:NitT/TauT family transport system substrate-binding protein